MSKTARELATEAVRAKEFNADTELADAWIDTLERMILRAWSIKAAPEKVRAYFLTNPWPHPTKPKGPPVTAGEVLKDFGLVEDTETGIIWND